MANVENGAALGSAEPTQRDIRSAEGPHRFEALDSMRAVCAILVAFMHLQANHHLYANQFVRHSFAFVDFFFVLSGWVISYAYSQKLKSSEDARIFILRRIGRVYPLHLFMLVLLIVAQFGMVLLEQFGLKSPRPPFTNIWDPSAIPTHILLLQSFGNERTGTWNMPSWSISAEFWTYIVFAAVLLFVPARARVAAYATIAVAGLMVIHFFSPTKMDATFDYGIFRCFGGFFLGAIVQTWWKAGNRLSVSRSAWTAIEILSVLLVIATVTAFGRNAWGVTMPFVFAITVYVFAHEGGKISSILRTPLATKLGLWSYSIYMIQGIFVFILFKNVPKVLAPVLGIPMTTIVPFEGEMREVLSVGGQWGTDLATLIYLLMLIGTAALTFRYIEVPAREWIYARIRRKPKTVPPVSELSSNTGN